MTRDRLDLRLALPALAVWGAAAWGVGWTAVHAVLGALSLLALSGLVAWHGRHRHGADRSGQADRAARQERRDRSAGRAQTALAPLLLAAAALTMTALHASSIHAGPVDELAFASSRVEVGGVVASDPEFRIGTFAPYVLVRLRVQLVVATGSQAQVRTPVLVIADDSWRDVRLGDHIVASGRLKPAEGHDLAAVLMADPDPQVVGEASWVQRSVTAVRNGLVEATTPLPSAEHALVVALVDGDDSSMPADTVRDFQTTGLTHLLAVSGSNLTLVLSFVLGLARAMGLRGRWRLALGGLAVVFFVLLARPEPSVLRAAAMGVVALAGLSVGGRRRGMRGLCIAVVCLVLIQPELARSIGFLLSTSATAGILLWAPAWRDQLARWMPAALAEAVAVPLAAQLACTPAIAAISGQVSTVAVIANIAAAPAVGPATVIGLVAGLVALVSEPLAHLVGRLAGIPAWWIVTVSRHGADFAGSSLAWPVGPVAIVALGLLCLLVVLVLPRILASPATSLACSVLLVLVVVQPLGRLGWPPAGWLLVMCDVGQGDGMVLNAGGGVAVLVDTGPDPRTMDHCLDRLDVKRIDLVILTHFHADHVNGLPGALEGRDVTEIETTSLRDPPDRAAAVDAWAADSGVTVTEATLGESRTIGELTWTVVGPVRTPSNGLSDDGSGPNNASLVILLETHNHSFLLSGDAEPEEEDDILAGHVDLGVDVFKVAHHGSANQSPDFVLSTHARLALVSVGADNDYGHPAPETLALLRRLGAITYRTDLDGDIAVVDRAGQLAVVTAH